MVDRVDRNTRNRIMRANRARNTGPELTVRKALFAEGFRYRVHDRRLPGKPDMIFAKHKAVVFVHGCFWHGHNCQRRPHAKSNTRFWRDKIEANKRRDLEARYELLRMSWRVLVIWECAVRRRTPPFAESDDLDRAVSWLLGHGRLGIISENGFEECL
jgi:DNA mismatch endonuclease (patch repair protein)